MSAGTQEAPGEPVRGGRGGPSGDVGLERDDSDEATAAFWGSDARGLVELSGLVQSAFARVADKHDLTPAQGRLLCVLAQGPRGMADLARAFGVERAALTGLVDRAERRGLVQRVPVPGDRRAVNVAVTDAGTRSTAAFHTDVTTELRSLLHPLEAADREHLSATLALITSAAGGSPDWGTYRNW